MKINKVAVHNGRFHADDVFAVASLRLLYPTLEVVRSRDSDVIKIADARVDVGGKYDPATGDFDHHQKESVGKRVNGVPYAACGLVWKSFGVTVCQSRSVADTIEERLIQFIDALDCGQTVFNSRQNLYPYSIADVILALNPTWEEGRRQYDIAFEKALKIAETILSGEIKKTQAVENGKTFVRKAMAEARHKKYIILDKYCAWEEVVINESELQYVILPALAGGWRVHCVPVEINSYQNRKSLPQTWAGQEGTALANITGVADAVFCHSGRFIAGAETLAGAKKLVEIAIAAEKSENN